MHFIWSKKEAIRRSVTLFVCVTFQRKSATFRTNSETSRGKGKWEKDERARETANKGEPEEDGKGWPQGAHVCRLKLTNVNTVQCTGVSFISDRLLCSRLKRRIGWSSSVCRRRSCASMLRPSESRSRGWRRRSWRTLKPWNTLKRNRSAGKATELCRSATDVCSLLIFYCFCRRGTRNVKQSKSG